MKYIIDNKEYEVVIIKKNNKNTYIRVKEDLKIYVTTSRFSTKQYIKLLLDNNIDSIKKMIKEQTKQLKKKDYFYYLGEKYEVFIDDVEGIRFLDDAIFVESEKYLNKWLNKKIKELFQERLDYNYNRYQEKIPYPKLKIRTMKTRWGVCNIRDNSVTLNTKLIEYDIEKLDYVIIHELSHFIHFNHSKAFWNQVSIYTPNYKQIRKDLKE